MKTNDSVVGGSLKAASYQDFAEYLAAYVKGYREHHGIEITEISPANEPDLLTAYSSCIWTGDQYADFLKNYLKPEFERQKIKAHVVAPELIEYSKAGIKGHRGLGYTSLFEDDKAMNAVDIIGTHFYEDTTYEPLPKEYRREKPVWMTEYCELVPGIDNVTDFGMRSGLFIAKSIHRFLPQLKEMPTSISGPLYHRERVGTAHCFIWTLKKNPIVFANALIHWEITANLSVPVLSVLELQKTRPKVYFVPHSKMPMEKQ